MIAEVVNGVYSVTLPASPLGLPYEVEYSDFTAEQRIAINNYSNQEPGFIRDVVTITTDFGHIFPIGDKFGIIPAVDPVALGR